MTKIVYVSGGQMANNKYEMNKWFEPGISGLSKYGYEVFNNPIVEKAIVEAMTHYSEEAISQLGRLAQQVEVTYGFKSSKASFKMFWNSHDVWADRTIKYVNDKLWNKMCEVWLKPSLVGGKFDKDKFAKCVAENRLY